MGTRLVLQPHCPLTCLLKIVPIKKYWWARVNPAQFCSKLPAILKKSIGTVGPGKSCSILLNFAQNCSKLLKMASNTKKVLVGPGKSCSILLNFAQNCSILLKIAQNTKICIGALANPAQFCSIFSHFFSLFFTFLSLYCRHLFRTCHDESERKTKNDDVTWLW